MAPSSPSLPARLPPSLARTLHACFFTHTATVLHFRCATELSSAPRLCAHFSAYRDVNGYEVVRGRPCATSSAISSSIITTRDRDAHQALHNPTSLATLRTKARPKPKPSPTRTTMRGPYTTAEMGSCFVAAFPYVGGADTEVVRRVPALAFGCADVAPAFCDVLYPLRGRPVWDVGDLVEILILLREGGGVALWLSRLFTRHAFPLPGVFVSPPSSVRAV
ncbi:hypothetical protein K438DRAFT_1966047 [Mycena galopus ATCC 62051]|nr:hypothetical protein K438DRAFT_1966047 [Mycena galopus ATCC 62051]